MARRVVWAWVGSLLLGGCSGGELKAPGSQPPESPASQCGNHKIDDGEVCDTLLSPGCAADCLSLCGNGSVEGSEVCDDGNSDETDGCAANCAAACGNGVVEGPEACDDANDALGDGCYRCKNVGSLVWTSTQSCGSVSKGNNDTVLCANDPNSFYQRYDQSGQVTVGPAVPTAALQVQPQYVVELPSGDAYVAARYGSSASGVWTVRIYRLSASGEVQWQTDLADRSVATGREPSDLAMALSAGLHGAAVVGAASSPESGSRAFLGLLDDKGLLRRVDFPDESEGQAIAAADDGTVFAGGGTDPSSGLYRTAWLESYDAAGNMAWSWMGPFAARSEVQDIRVHGDVVLALTERIVQNDIAQAPGFTDEWAVQRFDRATGTLTGTQVVHSQTIAEAWSPELLPRFDRARLSDSDVFESFAFGQGFIAGYQPDGSATWNASRNSQYSSLGASSVAVGSLLCLSDQRLACYLTR